MKWTELSWYMKSWWVFQCGIYAMVMIASFPVGTALMGLFVWYVIIPVWQAPDV